MHAYLYPITTALWQFPVIAAVLTLPYVVWCYRKYGSVSVLRSLILFSMLFYLQCVVYLCVLPLPDPAKVAAMTGPRYNLVPFKNIIDFIEKSSFELSRPATWLRAMRESYFLEPMFNLLLLVPFGVYLAYYFESGFGRVVLLSFLLSLLMELTQLTGIWGVYPRPYRLFDVNDLMLNTLGGAIGFAVYRLFRGILPSRRRIDADSVARGKKVGYIRRLVALAIDGIFVVVLAVLTASVTNLKETHALAAAAFVYFPLLAMVFKGATPGKAIVRIKITKIKTATAPLPVLVLLRCTLRFTVVPLYLLLINLAVTVESKYQVYPIAAELVIALAWAVDLAKSTKKGKRLWYERATSTQNTATRAKRAGRAKRPS